METMATFGLDSQNPVHVAAWDIGTTLKQSNAIPKFDSSIIFLIIQILQSIAPLIEEYCGDDGDKVAKQAKKLRGWRRLNWLMIIRSHVFDRVGRRGWRQLGRGAFSQTLIDKTAANEHGIVTRVMRACA